MARRLWNRVSGASSKAFMALTETSLDAGDGAVVVRRRCDRVCGGVTCVIASSRRARRTSDQVAKSARPVPTIVGTPRGGRGARPASEALGELAHLEPEVQPEPLRPVVQVHAGDLL